VDTGGLTPQDRRLKQLAKSSDETRMTSPVVALRLGAARPVLLRVDETTDDNGATVTVTLSLNGNRHVGTVVGDAAAAHRPTLVATAALRAVSEAVAADYTVAATSIDRVGSEAVAIVLVHESAESRPLVGAAIIEIDNHQVAFARAALDAVNRRVSGSR
jgi:hypothetical protein